MTADLVTGLGPLLAPRGIVVVGASTEATKLGGTMAASLARRGDSTLLVNSRGGPGMHTSVAAAAAASAQPLDLAVLCVPAAACAPVLAECAEAGVRAALVCAGGFAEAGGDGIEHQRQLAEVAATTGIRLLGPNTSGFFVPGTDLLASFVPGVAQIDAGSVAVVAASGGLNHALCFALQRRGIGVSVGVGIGAGIDVNAPDVLDYLKDDQQTRAIILHLENVADGPALLAAVKAASENKPVIAMVVGQHDIGEFARSHTGALATSWRTTRALLRQAGAVLVDDEEDLVTAASVLSVHRLEPRANPGVALVTAQAGPGLLIADALHGFDVRVPTLNATTQETLSEFLPPMTFQANPVDTGRPGPRHGDVLAAVAADPQVDLVAVYGLTEPVVDLPKIVATSDLGDAVAVIGLDGPADEVENGCRAATGYGLAAVVGARAVSTAVRVLVDDARQRHERLLGTGPNRDAREADVRLPSHSWTEARAKDALELVGIDTPARAVCRTLAEARTALGRIGGPVAVKLSDADVVHKSDHGGVHLGIRNPADLATAVNALTAIDAHEMLVEAMAPPGVDLVVGARRDPVFGPVVVLGIGGIATEVYADVAIAAVPAPATRLAALPHQLAARAMLDGFRGSEPVDYTELGRILGLLGDLLVANPHIDEIEINPLRAHAGGLQALDAVIIEGPEPDRRGETT